MGSLGPPSAKECGRCPASKSEWRTTQLRVPEAGVAAGEEDTEVDGAEVVEVGGDVADEDDPVSKTRMVV